jgi:hypothetical protein
MMDILLFPIWGSLIMRKDELVLCRFEGSEAAARRAERTGQLRSSGSWRLPTRPFGDTAQPGE